MNKDLMNFVTMAQTGAEKSIAYDRVYARMWRLSDEQIIALVFSCGDAMDMKAREIADPLLCELNTRRSAIVPLVIYMWVQGVRGEDYARYLAESEENEEGC